MRITLIRHALLYFAAGAPFLAGTLEAGLVSGVSSSGQFIDLNQSFGCSNTGTTTASCSVQTSGDAYHNASGSNQANAQYGSLDVTSRSSVYGGYLAGSSSASFSDTFLLTGGIGSGTLVFVTEYGGYGQCDPGECELNSTVALNTFSFHPNGNFYLPINLSFSFTFGTLFNLSASATAYSSALRDESPTQTAHLKIDAIEVLDSNGALITDYGVTSGSSAAYPFVTPEPGTFALFIGSLVALLVIRRKSITSCRRG